MNFILAFILICSVSAFPSVRKRRETTKVYDVVNIEINEPETRNKRSTDEIFPSRLHVKFTSKGKQQWIRLRRSPTASFPVSNIINGKLTQVPVEKSKRSAAYHDINTGAPVLVKRSTEGFYLDGTLSFDNQHFVVKRSTDGNHEILDKTLDFTNDEVLVPSNDRNQNTTNNNDRRQKRQSVTSYNVEMIMVFDQSVVKRFQSEFNKGNVDSELMTFAEVIVHGMNLRYTSITSYHPDTMITIELSELIILKRRKDAPFLRKNFRRRANYVKAQSALNDLVEWRQTFLQDKPNDHVMWLTDEILGDGGSTGTIGIAYVSAMCSTHSVSITEDYETGTTIQVAAHELGHSLGSLHDGEYSGCSDSQSYMMSAYVGYPEEENLRSNPFRFSSCSADAIHAYVTDSSRAQCLVVDNDGVTKPLPDHRAGEIYSLDQQCRQAFDTPDTSFCSNPSLTPDDFCLGIDCVDPDNPSNCVGGILPYEHTECAPGKWCVEGRCETKTDGDGGEGSGSGGGDSGSGGSGGDGNEGNPCNR